MSQTGRADGSSGWAAVEAPFEPVPSPRPQGEIPSPAAPAEDNLRLVPPVDDPAAAPTVSPEPTVPPQGSPDTELWPSARRGGAPVRPRATPRSWPPAPEAAWAGEGPSGRGRRSLFGVLVAVVVLVGSGGIFWSLHFRDDSPGTTSAAEGSADPVPPTEVQEQPAAVAETGTPEDAALAQLDGLRAQTLASLSLDGRWVAMVASKSVGITDPLQTAQNGTHTFYAADILAESQAVQTVVPDPSMVLVLQSPDFGRALTAPDGQPYWVTLVDGGFSSSADVEAWCAQTYPNLDPAALANACVARTLTPPQS
jgi:hypothetical protein